MHLLRVNLPLPAPPDFSLFYLSSSPMRRIDFVLYIHVAPGRTVYSFNRSIEILMLRSNVFTRNLEAQPNCFNISSQLIPTVTFCIDLHSSPLSNGLGCGAGAREGVQARHLRPYRRRRAGPGCSPKPSFPLDSYSPKSALIRSALQDFCTKPR